MGAVSPKVLDSLLQFREFEKWTGGYIASVATKNLGEDELEEYRHPIESILLKIAADNRRIDDWEKEEQGSKTR